MQRGKIYMQVEFIWILIEHLYEELCLVMF